MKTIALHLISMYRRWISPMLPAHCRFEPTCSAYAAEAIQHHGFFRGVRLTFNRLFRCHPFCKGGYDPVPTSLNHRECHHA